MSRKFAKKRVPGLDYSFFTARLALRERLARLPRDKYIWSGHQAEDVALPVDYDVVRLLREARLARNSASEEVEVEYKRLQSQPGTTLPEYAEAQARGWFRAVWNDVVIPYSIFDAIRHINPDCVEHFCEFSDWLYKSSWQVAEPGTYKTASSFEAYLLDPNHDGGVPATLSPSWIAARQWGDGLPQNLDLWTTKWRALGCPFIAPTLAWSRSDAAAFRQAVLDAARHGNLPTWDENERGYALIRNADIRKAEKPTKSCAHLLGLHLRQSADRFMCMETYSTNRLSTLLSILVQELPHTEEGMAPAATAETLLDLALLYPDVLAAIIAGIRHAPEAMADFMLCPRGVVMVTYLVACWGSVVQINREHQDSVAISIQDSLLEDCFAVIRHFLVQETLPVEEYSYLLVALQELDERQSKEFHRLPIVLRHVGVLPSPVDRNVIASLISKMQAGNNCALVMMLKAAAILNVDFSAAQTATVAASYKACLAGPNASNYCSMITDDAAAALMQMAIASEGTIRNDVFEPVDVCAVLASGTSSDRYKLSSALRSHISILCRAVAGYPESIPSELVTALIRAIHSGARDCDDSAQIDAFTWRNEPWGLSHPIETDLVDAIVRIELQSQQKRVIDALLEIKEPLVLLALFQRLPDVYKSSVRARLHQLSPNEASCVIFAPHLEQRISAFLDAGLPELAQAYMSQDVRGKYCSRLPDMALMDFIATLRLSYLQDDFETIAAARSPESLPQEHKKEAQRSIDFFKALVLLHPSRCDAQGAAVIFKRLHENLPRPEYAVNLLAARTMKLLGDNMFKVLRGDSASQAVAALRDADIAIVDLPAARSDVRRWHVPNCAALFLAVGRPQEALQRLSELEASEQTADSMAYEAVAHARSGTSERAAALLGVAALRFPSSPIIKGAEKYLSHAQPYSGPVPVAMQQDLTKQIRASLSLLSRMSPAEQASMLIEDALPLERVVTNLFRDALASFQRQLSFLHLDLGEYYEDDFNGLLAETAQGRTYAMLDWQPHEQSPGGFTTAGNAGRRDIALRARGVDIAVIEAIISKRPNDKRIVEHLHKLFSYTTTDILLHVTYSFRENLGEMVEGVRKAACQPPLGTDFISLSDIAPEGGRPPGMRGAYRRNGENVAVLFFVIDMAQHGQRQATNAPSALS